jgi:Acetylornithine deacetylase/Succinyl-diaminopimelate desuccinylase and related deacylases
VKKPLAVLALAISSAIFVNCRGAGATAENPVEREAAAYLSDYLRIDTSNPPGNETAAAEFLKKILDREGIESQIVGTNPSRCSLYARLRSGSSEPALLLLHHMDVVPANPAEWSVAPFAATHSNGYFWGRGALDDKSLGVAQLIAVLELHRSHATLRRDVVFLAVADEEAGGGAGTAELLRSRPDLFQNVGWVLNEGGSNSTVVDRVSLWGIEVTQKVPLWLKITATGKPGHAATPPDDGGSIVRLIDAIENVRAIPRPYRMTPAVARFLAAMAQRKKSIDRRLITDPESFLASPEFERTVPLSIRVLLRDTLTVTKLEAGSSVNSIPATASAMLDFRLLPDRPPDEFLSQVKSACGAGVTVDVLVKGDRAPESSADTELYRTMSTVLASDEPGSAVAPIVIGATTDSRFFRERGIVAYGFSPFKLNYYDAPTIHGVDERIRDRFFFDGVALMKEIVTSFCVQPGT